MHIGFSTLDSKTILSLHQSLIDLYGGKPGFRNGNQLEAMVAEITRHFESLHEQGKLQDDDYFDIVAAYFYKILKTKPFISGNQRTALAIVLCGLEGLNEGMGTQYDEEELFTMVMDTSMGKKSQKEVADYLRTNSDSVYLKGSYFI